MTNVYGSEEKVNRERTGFSKQASRRLKSRVIRLSGYRVREVASLRKITKDGKEQLVSIRTTQDTWIAFPRDKSNTRWVTLSDVDAVVAVSVDDPHDPKFANVHMIDGNEMRFRFDRAYAARLKAGHTIPSRAWRVGIALRPRIPMPLLLTLGLVLVLSTRHSQRYHLSQVCLLRRMRK